MLIFIRGLSGAVTPVNVSPHESALSVKIRMFYLKNIPIHDQHLLYSGVELTDQTILSTVNIGHGALLLLVLGLKTGPLGRYDLCSSIHQKYSTGEMSSQSYSLLNTTTTNNNNSSNDEMEYTRLLSLLTSSSSPHSFTSSLTPTVVFPSTMYITTPLINTTSNQLKQMETNLFVNSLGSYNNDEVNHDNNEIIDNSNHFISSHEDDDADDDDDDQINQIAEILGYAIDENEHLSLSSSSALYDVSNEHQMYNDTTDEMNCQYYYNNDEQLFQPQFHWLIPSNYNFTQHLLSIPETNSHLLCNNMNSNNPEINTSIPTTATTTAIINTDLLNSSADQLKSNSHLCSPSSKQSCLSSPNVNVIVDNDNNNIRNNLTPIGIQKSIPNNNETTAIVVRDVDGVHSDRHCSSSNTLPLLNTTTTTTATTISNPPILSNENYLTNLLINNNNSTNIHFLNPLSISSPCSYSFYLTMQMKLSLLFNSQYLSNHSISSDINGVVMNKRRSKSPANKSSKLSLNQNDFPQNITEKLLTPIDNFSQIYSLNTTVTNDTSSSDSLQSLSLPSSHTATTHSNQSRCYECHRRTRLACGFSCRCERWFCSRHHHPEDHQCNFQFKTMMNLTLK
ncbi:unnamed protein product [Schistosoma turkestanicum]|nr:unnamed protein product [Schistosoma turkestanicum]